MKCRASEWILPKCCTSLFVCLKTHLYQLKLNNYISFSIFFFHYFRWTKVLKLASKAELQNLDEDLESSQNKADLKRNSSFTSSTSTTNSIQSADWTNFRCGEQLNFRCGNGNSFPKKQNILFVVFPPTHPTVCWNGVLRGHFLGIKMQHWNKCLISLL